MTRLILHVGPGKCGSSSIQQFFNTEKLPCEETLRYQLLIPRVITKLNREKPNPDTLAEFEKFLSQALEGCDALILSHEWLFQNPLALRNIARLAWKRTTPVSIVGYSRKQSDFVVSAYSQWWFRSTERVNEVLAVCQNSGLDPALFTGLERQLIASITNDFHSARHLVGQSNHDWSESYNRICENVDDMGATVTCGVLPGAGSGVSLIADFCEKSRLTLRSGILEGHEKVSNQSFNPQLIEALNSAVVLGLDMPGPHEENKAIGRLSAAMPSASVNNADFLTSLKSYTDTYYVASNRVLSRRFGLDEAYFAPAKSLGKQEIRDIILQENHQRSEHKSAIIQSCKMLSGKLIALSLELAKDT